MPGSRSPESRSPEKSLESAAPGLLLTQATRGRPDHGRSAIQVMEAAICLTVGAGTSPSTVTR